MRDIVLGIVETVRGATWVDALDVVLLAVIIDRVLAAIRGTRALQSLVGLLLLGLLYGISGWSGLGSVHWVLDHLFVYVVITLLILFQEDIRRVLARAGGAFGRSGPDARSEASVMEEVIKACFALAHRRIGALILVHRGTALGGYVEGGHRLDAAVSTELLQAVFHPSSPLHDGAVVLSGGRVVAAGVFLPISLSKQLSKTLGTRHRAAVGITEETDGLCLVVSEERGTVALVERGEITPVADSNDLRQQLLERLGRPAPAAAAGVAGG